MCVNAGLVCHVSRFAPPTSQPITYTYISTCTNLSINKQNTPTRTHDTHSSIIAKKLMTYFGGYENVFKVRHKMA